MVKWDGHDQPRLQGSLSLINGRGHWRIFLFSRNTPPTQFLTNFLKKKYWISVGKKLTSWIILFTFKKKFNFFSPKKIKFSAPRGRFITKLSSLSQENVIERKLLVFFITPIVLHCGKSFPERQCLISSIVWPPKPNLLFINLQSKKKYIYKT